MIVLRVVADETFDGLRVITAAKVQRDPRRRTPETELCQVRFTVPTDATADDITDRIMEMFCG